MEYAVTDREGRVVSRTEGFVGDASARTLPLSDGFRLLIVGEEILAAENRELQHQLEEAKAANAAKEIFLSNMSHDIRTPMNAIVGMTALAKKHIDEKTRVADALNKIETASGHLLSLINDVLDMSRISSGRMRLTDEAFSLSDLLHDTLTIIRPQMELKKHHYSLTTSDIQVESLRGDPLRLRQVFANILSNAVKYTPSGGDIRIGVSERMDGDRCRLVFTCRDNGIGMSEDFLQHIFEPFERVSNSTVSRIEGTGLGMSIVKKTVDAMGGQVDIRSRLNEGTQVTVDVPLFYERISIHTGALQDKRLLILEANQQLASDYTRYLGEYGIENRIVASPAEAIDALTEAAFIGRSYQAVIIGSERGESTSVFDIASYLNKSYPELTLILISHDAWEEIEYKANRCGVRHFIPLPFFRKSLLNGLNLALQDPDEPENSISSPDMSGKHILLVEDNMINREIALEILSVTSAVIDTAEDGQQALDRYMNAAPGYYSLILMDVQMPVMDGYAASRAIRASGRADALTVPIYAMTANTFAEDIARARSSGMNGHIAKPIDINLLMQTIRNLQS